eukprot:GILJ01004800.1.p1 GENE.GILJ01004800.1~~GILJ01004800.1.p1  ORF type:complete len:441 (-),score=55.85 GILJ01004800.1:207-1529(-)
MWSSNSSSKDSKGFFPGRYIFGPLFLITVPPIAVTLLWHTNVNLGGSYAALLDFIGKHGLSGALRLAMPAVTATAVTMVVAFMAFEILLLKFLPGKTYYGPVTPAGNVPVYKANGFQAFAVSFAVYSALLYTRLIPLGFVFDNFGSALAFMNIFSLGFCALLALKGRFFPSSSDCGTSGNPIFDYYWGTELYPRIFGIDVKQFTNCRFGMMAWALLIVSFAAKQYEQYGYVCDSLAVSVGLQLIYIAKFFWWETGYLSSIDIMHDRAGYYICWGCLVFVPGFYTLPSFYIALNPTTLGLPLAAAVFLAGVLSVYINYDCDRQRQTFRKSDGKCTIWGKQPEFIVADYVTEKGEKKKSLLLLTGWWSLARHFHYVPELSGTFFWSCSAGFSHLMPFSYFCFLCLLLLDRQYRDDERCRAKYGKHWAKYCARVPYRIIPGVF